MSSPVSVMPASSSRSVGRHGAKPTPQLPIKAVVIPCQLRGGTSGSHPIPARPGVEMGVQVDETWAEREICSIDLATALADRGNTIANDVAKRIGIV